MITLILDQMKEIVTKILDVIMFLVPFLVLRQIWWYFFYCE